MRSATDSWTIDRVGRCEIADYYQQRLRLHFMETYAGIPMLKFPEDLRVYEHLLWDARISTVVEVGALSGGSALWFRDRLLANARYGVLSAAPQVISIDTSMSDARQSLERVDPDHAETILLIEADVRDPSCADVVGSAIAPGARVMVVDDCAHTYETTTAALTSLARYVSPGSYFVVEDGHRDLEDLRLANWGPPPGEGTVTRALQDWLGSPAGAAFVMRRDLERYIVTSNPFGYLQRTH